MPLSASASTAFRQPVTWRKTALSCAIRRAPVNSTRLTPTAPAHPHREPGAAPPRRTHSRARAELSAPAPATANGSVTMSGHRPEGPSPLTPVLCNCATSPTAVLAARASRAPRGNGPAPPSAGVPRHTAMPHPTDSSDPVTRALSSRAGPPVSDVPVNPVWARSATAFMTIALSRPVTVTSSSDTGSGRRACRKAATRRAAVGWVARARSIHDSVGDGCPASRRLQGLAGPAPQRAQVGLVLARAQHVLGDQSGDGEQQQGPDAVLAPEGRAEHGERPPVVLGPVPHRDGDRRHQQNRSERPPHTAGQPHQGDISRGHMRQLVPEDRVGLRGRQVPYATGQDDPGPARSAGGERLLKPHRTPHHDGHPPDAHLRRGQGRTVLPLSRCRHQRTRSPHQPPGQHPQACHPQEQHHERPRQRHQGESLLHRPGALLDVGVAREVLGKALAGHGPDGLVEAAQVGRRPRGPQELVVHDLPGEGAGEQQYGHQQQVPGTGADEVTPGQCRAVGGLSVGEGESAGGSERRYRSRRPLTPLT